MTTIVGIRCTDRIVMGADAAACGATGIEVRHDTKVFETDGYLIGYTTSFRMGQILRYCTAYPTPPEDGDLHAFMVQEFVPAIRQAFEDHGFKKSMELSGKTDTVAHSQSGQDWGGSFLVGVRGELFFVGDDFQVGIPALAHHAIGSGAHVAYGVLFATQDLQPEERIRIALEASVEHTMCVRPPFCIRSLP